MLCHLQSPEYLLTFLHCKTIQSGRGQSSLQNDYHKTSWGSVWSIVGLEECVNQQNLILMCNIHAFIIPFGACTSLGNLQFLTNLHIVANFAYKTFTSSCDLARSSGTYCIRHAKDVFADKKFIISKR